MSRMFLIYDGHTRHDFRLDWLQSPVSKYFFVIILFDNSLKLNQNNIMAIKAGHSSDQPL